MSATDERLSDLDARRMLEYRLGRLRDSGRCLVVVWLLLPMGVRMTYGSLLERGRVEVVRIVQGQEPLHERFGGMAMASWFVGQVIHAISVTAAFALPTQSSTSCGTALAHPSMSRQRSEVARER